MITCVSCGAEKLDRLHEVSECLDYLRAEVERLELELARRTTELMDAQADVAAFLALIPDLR